MLLATCSVGVVSTWNASPADRFRPVVGEMSVLIAGVGSAEVS